MQTGINYQPGSAISLWVFMIPYFCALLLLGIPICCAEWTMGKAGGRLGKHSCPAILGRVGGRPADYCLQSPRQAPRRHGRSCRERAGTGP